jgi:hypothetical protein
MYSSTSLPEEALSVSWLGERYLALHAQYIGQVVPEPLLNLHTLACSLEYNQTVCFLFQPLLLHALRFTHGQDAPAVQLVVAADSYCAALELIRTYDKIVRGVRSSILGRYPITILSAHHIWTATATLVAHAALALTGRVKVLTKLSDDRSGDVGGIEAMGEEATLDLSTFIDVSGTCSILLHWCAERWPRMLGLLDVYDGLMRRLTRELIVKGLAT